MLSVSPATRDALQATAHCFTGCAIGEAGGLIVGTALGLSNVATIALAIALAFIVGYALTIRGMRRAGLTLGAALSVALAADTASIGAMEIADNLAMVVLPGAMGAAVTDQLFWTAMALALAIGFVAAVPVNRYLIVRGKGHAIAHQHHHHHH